jgi:CHAT domain-containing protein
MYRSIQQLQQALYQDPIRRQQFSTKNLLPLAQDLYSWIIPPALETKLHNSGVKTLVFVLDGPLRNLPMAVLHDGKNYLGSSYGIAVAPGLQLLEPQQQVGKYDRVLLAGLTKGRDGFSDLNNVDRELKSIGSKFNHLLLLDQKFTRRSLEEAISSSSFSIVHLATHGQFSSQAEDTFLLTSDGRVRVNEFDRILKQTRHRGRDSLHLLVLSACQTAAGDDKAILGLAGMAIKSGASSTLATLWPVSDEATADFMKEFYRVFAAGSVSKAEALRQAQQVLMANPSYQHPYFWSAYSLVGNWK